MSEPLAKSSSAAITENEKLVFPVSESNKSRLVGKLRYWWCWVVAGSMLLFIALPALPFLYIINRRLWLYPIALWGAKTWLHLCGAKVRVTGTEHLEPGESYVFVSNHRSYLDTAALFRFTGKRIGIVAKKELLKVPVLGQGMHFVNILAIDRSNPDKALSSMENARKVMESGYSFGIFAEGTRALPGELLPFKKGAFHLALQTNARIVPVSITNTDWMMGKRTGVLYPGTIEMKLSPPLEIMTADGPKDVMTLLEETRAAVAANLGQVIADGEATDSA
ncbi:MAG: 1-acyl-sn-glycerol-3-phosphate acyltransferase [Blastocatellia bacterium]|nr:1-acyl-sn-glycerol-3-phosphate acyltransferase [Blastocatellia bacterium]